MKAQLTKVQLKERVLEEAKVMKESGIPLTLAECKKEAERVFREEFKII